MQKSVVMQSVPKLNKSVNDSMDAKNSDENDSSEDDGNEVLDYRDKRTVKLGKWTGVELIFLLAPLLVHHNAKWRMNWDLYVMLLAVYNCMSIPFEVAFDPEEPLGYKILNYVCDFSFAIDIILAFRTTYLNEYETEIIDQRQIAKHYACSRDFIIDLGATIPIDDIYIALFVKDSNADASKIKLLGLLKLVRLLRLRRIIRYLNFKQGAVLGMMLFQLLAGLCLIVHWIGCVWYLMISDGDWVPPKELDYPLADPTNLYSKSDFFEQSITFRYITVFYYAVLTMMGNEIGPRNTT